ncbi:histone-like nucleoid-structuring protein Lsr2 [Streptomyces violascens]|uniref:histone-like nucleoid-structuring protein Lsr2 n=1 Tax=Streptomyces violascens TaxID=67381 RepID=UPI0036B39159
MAQKIITVYTDDLTGEETTEAATHSLILDGVAYEMDLAPDSYDRLLEAVTPFTQVGRRVKRVGNHKGAHRPSGNKDAAAIRAWAKENGYEVNDRGRVSAEIREAYERLGRKSS